MTFTCICPLIVPCANGFVLYATGPKEGGEALNSSGPSRIIQDDYALSGPFRAFEGLLGSEGLLGPIKAYSSLLKPIGICLGLFLALVETAPRLRPSSSGVRPVQQELLTFTLPEGSNAAPVLRLVCCNPQAEDHSKPKNELCRA